jgi:hypothetical protein
MFDLLDALRRWPERTPGIPRWVWDARYDGAQHPQAPEPQATAGDPDPERGANCQLYAYSVLGLTGRQPPPHRSSDLWDDAGLLHPGLDELEPWDLVLFNRDVDAYGAHVAVCLEGGRLLHLCAEIGRPAVWTWADFAARERYATVIGAVRVPAEEPLAGGNTTGVVRIGDTVHREAGPWTPTIQQLLEQVRAAGVTGVPEPLGLDGQGREVVSYLPGDVPGWPAPEWLWSERVLAEAGRLLRRFHDATAGFTMSDAVWRLPVTEPAEVICHNDAAPYNMVFRDGRLVGLIDVDTASPGPRIRDLAYLAYRIAPLSGDAFAGVGYAVGHLQPMARLDALTRAYGMPFPRAEVLGAMVGKLRDLAAWTEARADDGGPAELREHAAMYRSDAARILGLMPPAQRPDRETSI